MNNPFHELILNGLRETADELRPPSDGRPDPAAVFAEFVGQQLGRVAPSDPASDEVEPEPDSAVDNSQGHGGALSPGSPGNSVYTGPEHALQDFIKNQLNR